MPEPHVGLVGLGRMGAPMAANLARPGLLAGVHNRTRARSRAVAAELGVTDCETPAQLAAVSDVVITVVSDAAAVERCYAGPDGLLAALRRGTLCLEMSTIGPDPVRRLGARLAAIGCALVDAPVSGSTAMAAAGTLAILAGGAAADVERAQPVLDALGASTLHMGPLGAGAAMKLAVNNAIYGLNQSVAESLVLAERAGIERRSAYEALARSAAAAPFVHYRRALFERPQTEAVQMRLALAAKDLALIEALAAQVGALLPQAALNRRVLLDAASAGHEQDDVTAVATHLRDRASRRAARR